MTDQEIVKKVLQKATENGYHWHEASGVVYYEDEEAWLYRSKVYYVSLHTVIFDHDFAKAFWNVDEPCDDCKYAPKLNCPDCLDWRSHLQTMVLEKNPIKYLETFL